MSAQNLPEISLIDSEDLPENEKRVIHFVAELVDANSDTGKDAINAILESIRIHSELLRGVLKKPSQVEMVNQALGCIARSQDMMRTVSKSEGSIH